jgi:hypothetical protein
MWLPAPIRRNEFKQTTQRGLQHRYRMTATKSRDWASPFSQDKETEDARRFRSKCILISSKFTPDSFKPIPSAIDTGLANAHRHFRLTSMRLFDLDVTSKVIWADCPHCHRWGRDTPHLFDGKKYTPGWIGFELASGGRSHGCRHQTSFAFTVLYHIVSSAFFICERNWWYMCRVFQRHASYPLVLPHFSLIWHQLSKIGAVRLFHLTSIILFMLEVTYCRCAPCMISQSHVTIGILTWNPCIYKLSLYLPWFMIFKCPFFKNSTKCSTGAFMSFTFMKILKLFLILSWSQDYNSFSYILHAFCALIIIN